MKKIPLFVSIAFLAACTSTPNPSKTEAVKTSESEPAKQENMTYPYMATYSSDFEIGDAKNVQTLLTVYQHWDNNMLDNAKPFFADHDTIFFSDGMMYAGGKDSLFVLAKKKREPMGQVVDSIHAWIPLRSKDKKEDWVVIWTRQISTNAQGKKTAQELQETWRFDKDGKINLMYQYEQLPPKMMPPAPKK
ncbi:hypothetical protein HHL17_22955 [Chitinophaga sp. G-6-1-13]|uniref:SnoaL-like domain-containing protein n=1 Tax=Chitinophaga fulva TaxID=2728842 RepID=A0A848GWN7_9BACT|nr:hypothetical protein [Chitinophaga fulva]NML40078.1 hypothetical protein [Chitinophaga fulva]